MANRVPILLYHGIGSDASPAFKRWVVSPILFAEHLAYLRQEGYTPLTVSEFVLYNASPDRSLPAKSVVVTFDDGFADFYENALPILDRFDFPATLYITTNYINGTSLWLAKEGEANRKMLSPQQIRELPLHHVECGAHTHTHPQLDLLSADQAMKEIVLSKVILERHLGKPVTSFAYPHGYYDGRIRQLVQKAGFTSACAVKHALSSPKDDSFALSRIIVSAGTTVTELARLMQGNQLPVAPQGERLVTKAWRWKRRVAYAISGD